MSEIKQIFRNAMKKGERIQMIWEVNKERELKKYTDNQLNVLLHIIRKVKKERYKDDIHKHRERDI